MTDQPDEVRAALRSNLQKTMTDDRGPRLRSDLQQVVIAKDTKNGAVLLGGLGSFWRRANVDPIPRIHAGTPWMGGGS